MKNSFYINYISGSIIIISFFIGLLVNENSSGGAENDSIAILNNVELFNSYNLNEIPWDTYKSTSLPLFYIFNKFLFNNLQFTDLILSNIFFSILILIIFFLILSMKFSENKIENSYLFLLSSIVLLSPYLRSSTFWGIEEVIGIFFFILSLFFYEIYKINKNVLYQILCLLSASLALLSRQSYVFLIIFFFFEFFNFKKFFDKKNIFLIFFIFFFNIPAIYFFYIWNGLLPPMAQDQRGLGLNIIHVPFILSILFIYFIPTILLNFKDFNDVLKFFKKYLFYIIIISLSFFLIIFFSDINKIGGGALIKIIYLINFNKFYLSFILSILSGIFLIYFIFYFEIKIKIIFLLIISIFATIDLIFQEYFDPISFLLINILFLSRLIKPYLLHRYIYFSLAYYSTFLIGSIYYYTI